MNRRVQDIKLFLAAAVFFCSAFFAVSSYAAPSGADVTHGGADINHSGNNTVINQGTDKAIINWDKFNIGANESVRFNQPNSSSVTLNRVTGGTRSEIMGNLSANGNVFILNSSGILIGNGASINVGSFLASTGIMSDKDFINSRYNINGAYNDIVNQGNIRVNNYGFAALLGRKVVNEGVISAHLGRVEIAAGESFTLNFYDNKLIGINIDKGATDAYIKNSGLIEAEGGTVYLSAKGISSLLSSTVNNEGVIRAGSLVNDGGKIVLSATHGSVNNSGTIDASSSIIGGSVQIDGDNVLHTGAITANGDVRGGIIFINSDESTTLASGSTATVNSITGKGGDIKILSNGVTTLSEGAILSSTSVTGNGGFVELSAINKVNFKGKIDLTSQYKKGGYFLLDPRYIYIVNNGTAGTNNANTTYITADDLQNVVGGGATYAATMDIYFQATELITAPAGTLTLRADNDIIFDAPNLTLDTLTLIAGNNIRVNAGTLTLNALISQLNGGGSFLSDAAANISAATLDLSAPKTGSFTINNLTSAGADTAVSTGAVGDALIGGNLYLKSDKAIRLTGVNVKNKVYLEGTEISNPAVNTDFIAKEMELVATTGNVSLLTSQFSLMSVKAGGSIAIANNNLGAVRFKLFDAGTTFAYTQENTGFLSFSSDKTPENNPAADFKATGTMNISNVNGNIEMPFLSVATATGGISNLAYFDAVNLLLYDYNKAATYGTVTVDSNNFFGRLSAITRTSLTLNVPTSIDFDVQQLLRTLTLISQTGDIKSTSATGVGAQLRSLTLVAETGDVNVEFYGSSVIDAILSVSAGRNANVTSTNTSAADVGISLVKLFAGANAKVDFSTYLLTNLAIGEVSVGGELSVLGNTNMNIKIEGSQNFSKPLSVRLGTKTAIFDVLNKENITILEMPLAAPVLNLRLESLNGDIIVGPADLSSTDNMYIIGRNLNDGVLKTNFVVTGTNNEHDALFRFSGKAVFDYAGKFADINGNDLKVSFSNNGTIRSSVQDKTDKFSMVGNRIELTASAGTSIYFLNTASVNELYVSGVVDFGLLSGGMTPTATAVADPAYNTVLNAKVLNINALRSIYAENKTGQAYPVINTDRAEMIAGQTIGGSAGGLINGDPNNNSDINNYLTLYAKNYARMQVTTLIGENSVYLNPENFFKALQNYEFVIPENSSAWMFDGTKAVKVDTNYFGIFQLYRGQYFLPMNDRYASLSSEFTAYENLLNLGGDMITSDIRYPRYISALYKINRKTELK